MFTLPRPSLLFVAFTLLVAGAALSRQEPDRAAQQAPAVGPARVAERAGVVAHDEAELVRLLEDPNGPETISLEAHAYHGDFRIRRRVTLQGTAGAELVGTGQGTVLSIEAPGTHVAEMTVRHSGRKHTQEDAGIKAIADHVVIRGVLVEDALFGISLGPCRSCIVERAHVRGVLGEHELRGDAIKLWEASDSRVQGCVVENGRDVVVWYSRRVQLLDNWVTHSRYGAHFMYAHDSLVSRSHFIDNVVGVFVMYSSGLRVENSVLAGARGAAGMGIGFKESDGVSLSKNFMVANTAGVYLDRTPRSPERPVRFDRNVFALNETALSFHSSERGVAFDSNDFVRNHVAVEVEGGGDATEVDFSNNYWSDYLGYDLDHDQVGDVPYEVKRLASQLAETRPSVRVLEGTLAMGLIDVMARALPVFSVQSLLADPSPRMSPK
jgi:nitrous oxidase accessory protein